MKTEQQIKRAHDLIVGILLGDAQVPLIQPTKDYVHIAADVLCWVLDHDHNPHFAQNLKRLEDAAKAEGYVLTDHGN